MDTLDPRARRARAGLVVLGLMFAALAALFAPACLGAPDPDGARGRRADPSGDPGRGLALVEQAECSRCHAWTGAPEPPANKHCFGCHDDILEGRMPSPDHIRDQWEARVRPLRAAPSLAASGKRYRRGWIERFLLQPGDLRPHLVPMMPRLDLTPEDARDIATYLAPDDEAPVDLGGADLGRGRQLLDQKGCGTCHLFTGVPPLAVAPPTAGEVPRAVALAPDLRSTRDRLRADWLVAYLVEPAKLKPDTLMPSLQLAEDEARDIAAYLLLAPLEPEPPRPVPARLPVLARRVSFEEVSARVLRRTCWHCHAEPDYAIGDGGPGNSGGFGFKPRGLNLASYEGVASGALDERGERVSVFAPGPDGAPLLVSALLARWEEHAGRSVPGVRGMPLGLPPLPPEDIQLVESWIAQGRPE